MKKPPLVLLTFAMLVSLLAACRPGSVQTPIGGETPTPQPSPTPLPKPTVPGEPLAALVNGEAILLADYQHQVAQFEMALAGQGVDLESDAGQAMLAQAHRQVLDVMIEQALIEQAAAREGLTISDAEVESVIARDIEENGGRAKFDAWLKARTPMERWGDPSELIGTVIFLASRASSFITGQIFYVDGGILATI